MTSLKNIALTAPALKTFNKVRLTNRQHNGKPAIRLYIPVANNGEWNDEYRSRLDALCFELSDLGFRWSADYPHNNFLGTKNEKGEPWMLLNGGEVVVLTHNPTLSVK